MSERSAGGLAGCSAGRRAGGVTASQRLALRLKRKTPETYTCTAAVYEPGTHHAYAAAREIVAVPGKAETSARVNGEYEVEFSVDISAAADRAQTRVTVRRNTIVVAEQRSTIVLPRSNGITPVQ